jgi:hypothetical protein
MTNPWESEPDSLDFEADGLPCAMRRNERWQTWCGYVGVPPEHPLYGLPTNHLLKLPASWFEGRKLLQGVGPMDLFIHILSDAKDDTFPISIALQVHGGVNFAEHGHTLKDGYWWFGFDCGHAGDFVPNNPDIKREMNQMVESMPEHMRATIRDIVFREEGVYRDQQYVVSECQSLAAQLNAIVEVLKRENVNGGTDNRGD